MRKKTLKFLYLICVREVIAIAIIHPILLSKDANFNSSLMSN